MRMNRVRWLFVLQVRVYNPLDNDAFEISYTFVHLSRLCAHWRFCWGSKNDKAYVYFTNSTLCSCTVGMWMLSVSLQVASHSNNDTKIYIRERKNRNRKFVIHWTIEGITALCLRLAYCAKRKKNTHFFLWLFESVWLSIGLYDNDNGARWFCYFHYVYSSIHVTCSPPLSIYRYICICIYNSFVFSSSAMFCFVIFFFVFLSPC